MGRSYSAVSLVALPRLSAISAARLIQELLTAATKEKKLPAVVAAARDDLVPAHEALAAEIARRVSGEGQETVGVRVGVRAADGVEDNAFGALVDWLRAFTRLPGERHKEAGEAQKVLDDVFSGGLEFLKIRPADEWQEAEGRLALLADKGHRPRIAKLGGQAFLDELAVAHKSYGEALGITVVKAVPESPAIREAMADAIHELRAYVLSVSSQVKKKDPATAALADRLLQPLIEWRDSPSKAVGPATDAKAKPTVLAAAPGAPAGK